MANRWPDSPWQRMPPLQAPPGVTAMSGQVLLLNGRPLADVTLEIEGRSMETDSPDASCSLGHLSGGWHELTIDGTTANKPGTPTGCSRSAIDCGRPHRAAVHDLDAADRHRARGHDRLAHYGRNGDHHAADPGFELRLAPKA